jgi:uncharacterized repeat protein (TIGR03803 family)
MQNFLCLHYRFAEGKMRALFSRSMAAAVIAAAVFAAVGAARAQTSPVIYSFAGGKDGASPQGTLIYYKGALWGTTNGGGGGNCTGGCGTVFEMTLEGKKIGQHVFAGGSDGANPYAGLYAAPSGTLYGTTVNGGGSANCTGGCGTVFMMPHGTVIYRFQGGSDGASPQSGLYDLGGTLYGTTLYGGGTGCGELGNPGPGCGTVFGITLKGSEWVDTVFSFNGDNGANPYGGLTAVGDTLYGTTSGGGKYSAGTVFKVTLKGIETVYSFKGGIDGDSPYGALAYNDASTGALLGTTLNGGGSGCGILGCGTVFVVTPEGVEKRLIPFREGSDGASPIAGLTRVGSPFYGTTSGGGGKGCGSYGCGTVFMVTPIGPRVLYRFPGGSGGEFPIAGLLDVGGTLYGATVGGGAHSNGTVFKLKPFADDAGLEAPPPSSAAAALLKP